MAFTCFPVLNNNLDKHQNSNVDLSLQLPTLFLGTKETGSYHLFTQQVNQYFSVHTYLY